MEFGLPVTATASRTATGNITKIGLYYNTISWRNFIAVRVVYLGVSISWPLITLSTRTGFSCPDTGSTGVYAYVKNNKVITLKMAKISFVA